MPYISELYSGMNVPQMREEPNDTYGRGMNTCDMERYQFWPTAVAMGSLIGKEFIQVSFPLVSA